ncbi:hypothetical protein GGI15_000415 [Coemansia interrupta]|uniref:Uncharacterized protein n=1 Tax=Coemansia interrupta TaxID=1126814 RepID=A0A9W8LPJ5_9FUNG|nr:hypothetical protein GGI15_000415 [Coemansia interrupta]
MTSANIKSLPIQFYSGNSECTPRTITFHYSEHSVVADAMWVCEISTGLDLSKFVLFAEYPIMPTSYQPLSQQDFKMFVPMPPQGQRVRIVQLIKEALAAARERQENTLAAYVFGPLQNSRLIRICVMHQAFASLRQHING